MGHYKANLRDIEFCLFDLLGRDELLGKGIFSEVDRDTAMGMLEEMKRLCENEIAASFVDGDRLGVEFDPKTGEGKVPESFKKSYPTMRPNLDRMCYLPLERPFFFSDLILVDNAGAEQRVSSRPSDAVALAIRVDAPILARQELFDQAGIAIPDQGEEEIEKFKEFLDEINPEDFA